MLAPHPEVCGLCRELCLLLLHPIAKYNLISSSTVGIIHGKQLRLYCDDVDEVDPALQSEAMCFLDKNETIFFSCKFVT